MNDTTIKKFSVKKLDAELFTPFTIASGSHRRLENAVFTLETAGGERGRGEAAIATHITGETRERTMKSLEEAGEALAGADVADYLGVLCRLEGLLDGNRAALAAAEMAVLDLACRLQQLSLWQFFGGREPVLKTDVTVVIGEMVESELASCAAAQFAGGLGGFDFIDLDTPFFIRNSGMTGASYLSADGVYTLSAVKAGIGIVPGWESARQRAAS